MKLCLLPLMLWLIYKIKESVFELNSSKLFIHLSTWAQLWILQYLQMKETCFIDEQQAQATPQMNEMQSWLTAWQQQMDSIDPTKLVINDNYAIIIENQQTSSFLSLNLSFKLKLLILCQRICCYSVLVDVTTQRLCCAYGNDGAGGQWFNSLSVHLLPFLFSTRFIIYSTYSKSNFFLFNHRSSSFYYHLFFDYLLIRRSQKQSQKQPKFLKLINSEFFYET